RSILKRMPHIPMVFTFNEILPWKKLSILERWYISRTDSIFTFSPNIRALAEEKFPINQRKIHVTGAGIDFPAKIVRSEHAEEKRKIVAFIQRAEDDLEKIKLFVDSIPPLVHQLKETNNEQKLIFTFITDIPWY